MPHISVKMFAGRDDETKMKLAEALQAELGRVLGCGTEHVTVAIEDKNLEQWGEVFDNEIQGPHTVIPARYDWDSEYEKMTGRKREKLIR